LHLTFRRVYDVFFAPDKEKHAAFLRAQKNVAEQYTTKGRSPTGVLRSLAAERRRTLIDLLNAGFLLTVINTSRSLYL